MYPVPQDIPEFFTYVAAAVLGLGLLSLIPVWWRGRARRAGRLVGFTENDVFMRNVSCSLLLFGIGGLIARFVMLMRDTLSAPQFFAFIAVWLIAISLICMRFDAKAR